MGQIPYKGEKLFSLIDLRFGSEYGNNDVKDLNIRFDADLKEYKVLIPYHKGYVFPILLEKKNYIEDYGSGSHCGNRICLPNDISKIQLDAYDDERFYDYNVDFDGYYIIEAIIEYINKNINICRDCRENKICKKGYCNICYGKYYQFR